jgi:alpha-amylase
MKKGILILLTILMVAPVMRAENVGVPAECGDVMLQAFYWDSYKETKYGRTKWVDLLKDTAAINANFDLVWLPPSAKAGSDGVGYNHKQLSNQDSSWGTKGNLEKLIAALHNGGTKVLGDIVINHRANKSNWCDFEEDKFGEGYGSFQLTEKHICSDDECFTTKTSTCYGSDSHGAADTGSKFDGLRDLDHTSDYVQEWAKTYLRWMIGTMHYDGFRHDMTLGFHGSYLGMYNEASQPYLSVSELWEGIARQKQHLEETGYNTMIFDFQQKYELHKAIVNGSYSKLMKNSNSFRGQDLERYAVTFIDNHDTFERDGYGNNQYAGQYSDLNKEDIKIKIMQAYAYILSMPGVPCVFWPHWYKYKDEINRLIAIRKLAGIHSESKVTDEAYVQGGYTGTVQGKNHKLIVRLGKNRDMTQPAGYGCAVNADYYTIYVEGVQGIDEVESGKLKVERGEKFMENGRLYIRCGEKVYDAQGREVRSEKLKGEK